MSPLSGPSKGSFVISEESAVQSRPPPQKKLTCLSDPHGRHQRQALSLAHGRRPRGVDLDRLLEAKAEEHWDIAAGLALTRSTSSRSGV